MDRGVPSRKTVVQKAIQSYNFVVWLGVLNYMLNARSNHWMLLSKVIGVASVKFKNTAILMIFWLFCQQAGAAAGAIAMVFPSQNELGSIVQTDVPCHDHYTAENIPYKTSLTSLDSHSDVSENLEPSTSSSQSCCDISCQCCMSGCQSMLSSESNQNIPAPSVYTGDDYLSVIPHTPASSLFRPPIFLNP